MILTFIYINPVLDTSLPSPYFQRSFPQSHYKDSSTTVCSKGKNMWATNADHMCSVKCYSGHIKKVKRNGQNLFQWLILSDPPNPKFILQHLVNMKILMIHFTFFIPSLWNLMCILHLQHISLWTSRISGFSSYLWLVPTPTQEFSHSMKTSTQLAYFSFGVFYPSDVHTFFLTQRRFYILITVMTPLQRPSLPCPIFVLEYKSPTLGKLNPWQLFHTAGCGWRKLMTTALRYAAFS